MNQRQTVAGGLLAVALVIGMTLPLFAEDIKGRIAGVSPAKNELVISESFKNWTFQLTKDSKVFINDRQSKLSELQTGDEATVTFSKEGEKLVASIVRSMRK